MGSMRRKGPLLFIVSMMIGCGSASTPEPEHGGDLESGPLLSLGELTFTDSGGDTLIVHADGRIENRGSAAATVSTDGTIVGPDGAAALTLREDGTIVDSEDRTLPVTVATDGSLRSDTGQELQFDDAGNLVGGNTSGPMISVTGLTAETRRMAMFVLVGFLLPMRAPSEPEASEAEVVTPVVDCSRINEPDYRAEMNEAGVDLDSIDCEECDGCEE